MANTCYTTRRGERISYEGLGADYVHICALEEQRLGMDLLGAALQKDMPADLREALLGVKDAFAKAELARRTR